MRDMPFLRKTGIGAPINACGRPQPTPPTLSPWLPGGGLIDRAASSPSPRLRKDAWNVREGNSIHLWHPELPARMVVRRIAPRDGCLR